MLISNAQQRRGNIPMALSAADYRALIARENDKWSKVIKFAGIKLG
jgi:hypothetical protein